MPPLALLPAVDSEEETSSLPAWEKQGEIEALFSRARRGEIPRYRELKPWEPALLNETHLQMIMMRSTGIRQRKIAEVLGVTDANVSVVVNHPDAVYIIDRMASLVGLDSLDIKERWKALLPAAVEAVENVLLDPRTPAMDKAKVGFGVFDRHYGKKVGGEIQHRHTVGVTREAAGLLSRAITEAREIEEASYVILPEGEAPGNAVPVTAASLAQGRAGGASTADSQEPIHPPESKTTD